MCDQKILLGLQCTLLGQNLSFKAESGEFVQILHTGASHWVCVSTFGCNKGQCNVFDSLYPTLPSKAVKQIAALLKCKLPSFELRYLDVANQLNTNECGCYAIAFAEALCRGKDPATLDFTQPLMCQHLLKCLMDEELTPFPATDRASKGIKGSSTIGVYCHCRQPKDSRRMIKSPKWFHSSCDNITPIHWKKPSSWLCKNCSNL